MNRCKECGQLIPLTREDVSLIHQALKEGVSVTEIASSFERPRKTIYRIKEKMSVIDTKEK